MLSGLAGDLCALTFAAAVALGDLIAQEINDFHPLAPEVAELFEYERNSRTLRLPELAGVF